MSILGGPLPEVEEEELIEEEKQQSWNPVNVIQEAFADVTELGEVFNESRQEFLTEKVAPFAQKVDDSLTNVTGQNWVGDRTRNVINFGADVLYPTSEDVAFGAALLPFTAADGPAPFADAAVGTLAGLKYGKGVTSRAYRKLTTQGLVNLSTRLDDWLTNPIFSKANRAVTPEGVELSPTHMMSKGSGSQKAWKSKRVIKGFDNAQLQVYDEAAWDYRRARAAEGKKQFMKGFVFENNSPIIRNKSGQEFMMVRKKKVNHPDKTHPDNYVLKSIWDVENDLITKSGWTKGAKDMDDLRVSLNRLRTNHPDEFYHILMEYGDNAYLEHKVAKKQPWFWNRKSQNPNFAPWLDNSITRNSEGNIRLLFNESFKSLKDVTESKLRVINKTITDDNFKYVIDLEDPIGGDFARRSNPGNILIREANSGDVIGIIPDYLQELFTTNFERNFTNSKMRGILSKPDIPEFYRIKPNETMKNYRSRILDERIDLIRNKAGQFDRIGMTGHINRDLVDFYELFDRKLGWVETPRYITEQGLYD